MTSHHQLKLKQNSGTCRQRLLDSLFFYRGPFLPVPTFNNRLKYPLLLLWLKGANLSTRLDIFVSKLSQLFVNFWIFFFLRSRNLLAELWWKVCIDRRIHGLTITIAAILLEYFFGKGFEPSPGCLPGIFFMVFFSAKIYQIMNWILVNFLLILIYLWYPADILDIMTSGLLAQKFAQLIRPKPHFTIAFSDRSMKLSSKWQRFYCFLASLDDFQS